MSSKGRHACLQPAQQYRLNKRDLSAERSPDRLWDERQGALPRCSRDQLV